jgi:hypothetical protein
MWLVVRVVIELHIVDLDRAVVARRVGKRLALPAAGQPELGNVPVRTRSAATSRSLVLDFWDA